MIDRENHKESISLQIPDTAFWTLILIIMIIGLTLRTYDLGSLPDGLYRDEAANGYDAYSIGLTGKSLHGEWLPLFFNHHGVDHVESLYTYLSVPFVYLFGLSVFSTRLLAGLAGTCAILTTGLLARELSGRLVGVIAAFIVAFSPWHLVFSRVAFRGVLLPLCTTLAIYLFLRALKAPRYFLYCGVAFGLTLHTYAVAKLLVPILALLLLILHRKDLADLVREAGKGRVHVLGGFLIAIAFAVPVYGFVFWGPGNSRFEEISVFGEAGGFGVFVQNIWLHLTPDFLFLNGDANPRHSVPGYGQLSVFLFPFVLLGLGDAYRKRSISSLLPPLAFTLGVLPAALTIESIPHALRSFGAFPFLEITAAAGIGWAMERMNRASENLRNGLFAGLLLIVLYGSGSFVSTYFGEYRATSQQSFQFGMAEALRIAELESSQYDQIVLSPLIRGAYVFVLFFTQSDPTGYQTSRELGKYVVDAETVTTPGRYLFLLNAFENLGDLEVSHWIRRANDEPYLKLIPLQIHPE